MPEDFSGWYVGAAVLLSIVVWVCLCLGPLPTPARMSATSAVWAALLGGIVLLLDHWHRWLILLAVCLFMFKMGQAYQRDVTRRRNTGG